MIRLTCYTLKRFIWRYEAGRKRRKKDRHTEVTAASIQKKVEAKNDQKTDFLRAVHNLHRKKVFTGVFFSLISLLRERYKNWDRSAENDPITAG